MAVCIYAIRTNGHVHYIGRACDLLARRRTHIRRGKAAVRRLLLAGAEMVRLRTCGEDCAEVVEGRLITWHKRRGGCEHNVLIPRKAVDRSRWGMAMAVRDSRTGATYTSQSAAGRALGVCQSVIGRQVGKRFIAIMKPKEKPAAWVKTPVTNLYKYAPSGGYYMRAKIHGEDVKRSLKTKSFEIAKAKLRKLHEDESLRIARQHELGFTKGSRTVGALIESYIKKDAVNHDLKPRTKSHHLDYVKCIRATWPELNDIEASKLTADDCDRWAHKVRGKYSASHHNGAVDVLRAILEQAVETGIRLDNPTKRIKKASVKQKELHLPSQLDFNRLLGHLDQDLSLPMKATMNRRKRAAVVIRFLAFTGIRVNEAAQVTPRMLDWIRNEIRLPGTVTKNGKERRVPILADLKPVLSSLVNEYNESGRKGPLMPCRDVKKSLHATCAKIGITRMTPHDLRHLFITRCIESGVDVKTVAEWVGHQDGGALILKTYAHLRNEHSQNMAKLVTFSTPEPENVLKLVK